MKNKIFVFSKAKCPYTIMMKKWFKDRSIEIEEMAIDDAIARELLIRYNLDEIKSPHLIMNNNSIGSYMDLVKQESFVFHLLGLNNSQE